MCMFHRFDSRNDAECTAWTSWSAITDQNPLLFRRLGAEILTSGLHRTPTLEIEGVYVRDASPSLLVAITPSISRAGL
jgi:hypothetical protein